MLSVCVRERAVRRNNSVPGLIVLLAGAAVAVPENMVVLYNGHVVPDAGLEVVAPMAVLVRRIEWGALAGHVDIAIVRVPGLVNFVAMGLLRENLADEHAGDSAEEVRRRPRQMLPVREGDGVGCPLRKVVDMRVGDLLLVDLLAVLDGHLIGGVVHGVLGNILCALEEFDRIHRLADLDVLRIGVKAKLLVAEVEELHEVRVAEEACATKKDGIEHRKCLLLHGGQCRSVVDAGEGRDSVDQVAVAALKQRREICGVGPLPLFRRALDAEVGKEFNRGAAKEWP